MNTQTDLPIYYCYVCDDYKKMIYTGFDDDACNDLYACTCCGSILADL